MRVILMTKEKVKAVVDIREPNELIVAVSEHDDVEDYEISKLEAGDIAIRGVGFERKTISDYASSLTGKSDRDLYDQVEKMKEGYDHGYILIEGDLIDVESMTHTNVNPNSLKGSMASIEARHGIPVKMCSNMELLVDKAIALARKHHEDPVSKVLPTGSISGIDEPFTKRVYGCIDGVQKSRAESLYERYPTVDELLDADKGEIRQIEGIGEKTADKIYSSFRTKD